MPKLTNGNPFYRKHQSGQAVVTVSGKDFYLGPWNTKSSNVEYDRLIAQWLANGRRLPAAADLGLSIDELISPFWEHCETFYRHPDGSPTGESENFHYALRAVRKLYTGTPATAFGPLALEAVMP